MAIAQITVPCETPHIIESKSFKLYLGSFNNSRFASADEVRARIRADVSQALWQGSPATGSAGVRLILPEEFDQQPIHEQDGLLLDRLDLECSHYHPAPELLQADASQPPVSEVLVSHLLKSNCLVTGQPDWGSVQIAYSGAPIDQAGLLQYLVSFRNHNEFHEQCVERIFMDMDALPAHQAQRLCPLYAPGRAGHQPVSHQPPAAAAGQHPHRTAIAEPTTPRPAMTHPRAASAPTTPAARMPTLFIPHGAGPCFFMDWQPAQAWDKTAAWLASIPASLPARPSAILLVTAHWLADQPSMSSAAQPGLLFDYYGFPPHTYQLRYPAAGAPALAQHTSALLTSAGFAPGKTHSAALTMAASSR